MYPFLYLLPPLLLLFLYLRHHRRFPPPIPFYEYFPSRPVFNVLRSPQAWSGTLTALSERYGDVFTVRPIRAKVTVTAVPADVAHILNDTRSFVRTAAVFRVFGTVFPGGVFTMWGERHLKARRVLHEALGGVDGFHGKIVGGVRMVVAELERGEGGIVDVTRVFMMMALRVIVDVLFGVQMEGWECGGVVRVLEVWADGMMEDLYRVPLRRREGGRKISRELEKCTAELRGQCERLIRVRKGGVWDGIATLAESEEGRVGLAMEMVVAGVITTAEQLAWCVYEVCGNDRVRVRMEEEVGAFEGELSLEEVNELQYVPMVWKEVCRVRSIMPGFGRFVWKDVVLRGSGVALKKGRRVWAHTPRTQTHPDIWKDAERFQPERWKNVDVPVGSYVPFSMGRRSCAGMNLANLEACVVLAEIYRRFRFELTEEVTSCTCFVQSARSESGGVMVRVRKRPGICDE